jgi:hypothetical protein
MKLSLPLFLIAFSFYSSAQQTKKVLFIGNSYTASNNLVQMIANMAQSTGDSLVYDTHTPGGNRFLNHAANPTVFNKIRANNWDFISLQGQSQEVAFDSLTFYRDVYPNVKILCDTIRSQNACSQPLLFTTWGRQNGDALNCALLPYMCTYQGMDSALTANYTLLAQVNQTEMSPVGPVWRYIRNQFPNLNLYAPDGSHPSLAGSYAAACTFYTMIFKKDPTSINWNSSLSNAVADSLKMAAKRIAYDSLAKWDQSQLYPKASFNIKPLGGFQLQFELDTLALIDSVVWDFGDGNQSTQANPSHTYATGGTYPIQLKNYHCGKVDSLSRPYTFILSSLKNSEKLKESALIYPNPVRDRLTFKLNQERDYHATIFDLRGQMICNLVIKQSELNVSDLKKGQYILIIEEKQGKPRSFSFIKN